MKLQMRRFLKKNDKDVNLVLINKEGRVDYVEENGNVDHQLEKRINELIGQS